MGRVTARVIVRTDASGKPMSVAAMLSAGALEGLPTEPNKNTREGALAHARAPGRRPATLMSSSTGNPHGHRPPNVYTIPHFDIHFYVVRADKVGQVAFKGADDPAIKVSGAALIPEAEALPSRLPQTSLCLESDIRRSDIHTTLRSYALPHEAQATIEIPLIRLPCSHNRARAGCRAGKTSLEAGDCSMP